MVGLACAFSIGSGVKETTFCFANTTTWVALIEQILKQTMASEELKCSKRLEGHLKIFRALCKNRNVTPVVMTTKNCGLNKSERRQPCEECNLMVKVEYLLKL